MRPGPGTEAVQRIGDLQTQGHQNSPLHIADTGSQLMQEGKLNVWAGGSMAFA